jgi:hypothetical protein
VGARGRHFQKDQAVYEYWTPGHIVGDIFHAIVADGVRFLEG